MAALLSQVLLRSGWKSYQRSSSRGRFPEVRTVYCAPNVQVSLDRQKSKLEEKQLVGATAVINGFVEGNSVSVSTPLMGDGYGLVKGLRGYNKKLFEIRFFGIAPQLRMIGVFPQMDVFLACQLVSRDDLDGNWKEQCDRILQQMKSMGKDAPECLTYDKIDEVLTNWRVSK